MESDLYQEKNHIEDEKVTITLQKKSQMSLIEAMSASVTKIEQSNFEYIGDQLPKQYKSVEISVHDPSVIKSSVKESVVAADISPAEGMNVYVYGYACIYMCTADSSKNQLCS